MSFTTRKAVAADADILAALGAKTFYDTFRPYHSEQDMQAYIHKAYDTATIKQNLDNPEIQYFLTSDGDKPIGYTKLIRNATHEKLGSGKSIELEKIYVLHEYFDKKAGKVLMDSALAFARAEGFGVMFLGVWQDNARAIGFYNKFGFDTFATRAFRLGQQVCDDFLMKLVL